jgi:DNA-binding LytR/AlgR family response regulator
MDDDIGALNIVMSLPLALSSSLTAVLIDDELPARLFLRELLANHPAIRVIGEADSASSALQLIEESKPDVIFLDIRLGKYNSFNILSKLPVPLPKIVFVTAFGQYAARAFDNCAIDYLLKPLDPIRVQKTVERLLASMASNDILALFAALANLSERIAAEGRTPLPPPLRFISNGRDKYNLVDLNSVTSIEAEGNYVYFNSSARRFRVRKPIYEVEHALKGTDFIRVSRSVIIRAADIVSFERKFRGRLNVHLRDGKWITCTAGYREQIFRHLGI